MDFHGSPRESANDLIKRTRKSSKKLQFSLVLNVLIEDRFIEVITGSQNQFLVSVDGRILPIMERVFVPKKANNID
jgi:hypothetical protein